MKKPEEQPEERLITLENKACKKWEEMTTENYESKWGELFDTSVQAKSLRNVKSIKKLTWFGKRVAVIVMGVSCCGKTTMAKKLQETIKNSERISLDDVGFQLLKEKGIDNDVVAKEVFSDRIAEIASSGKSIIVEGLYITPVRRSAMISFLRSLGYTRIILVNMMASSSEEKNMYIHKRAVGMAYLLETSKSPNEFFERLNSSKYDPYDEIPYDDYYKYLASDTFKNNCKEIMADIKDDLVESNYGIQVQSNLFGVGVDYVVDAI